MVLQISFVDFAMINYYNEVIGSTSTFLGASSCKFIPLRIAKDLRAFIRFPCDLYHDDPVWVPPLHSEQWAQFHPRKNAQLQPGVEPIRRYRVFELALWTSTLGLRHSPHGWARSFSIPIRESIRPTVASARSSIVFGRW